MPGLIGKKVGMTSMYSEEGKNLPCTVLEVGPCVVTQVKTADKDGYDAVQVGFGDRKDNRTSKAMAGHFKKAKVNAKQHLAEFAGYGQDYNPGDEVKLEDVFEEGEFVSVVGTSKGRGFQGVVRRHGFAGVGQATHGQHNRMRAPGSIGATLEVDSGGQLVVRSISRDLTPKGRSSAEKLRVGDQVGGIVINAGMEDETQVNVQDETEM